MGGGGVQKCTPLPNFPLLCKIQVGNQTFHDEVLLNTLTLQATKVILPNK